jgi:rhamnulokinase
MSTHHYIACDLGAESGRVMLGTLADGKLALEEVHRFPNGPIAINGSLRWDVLRLFEEIRTGLRKVSARAATIESVSADSWGVDYVWVKGNEPMVTAPYHYRDARTDGALERAFAVVPADEIFAETGIQFMSINTLYQLHADLEQRPWVVTIAEQFLNIGDYFNFLLSGVIRAEESLASTTQLFDPVARRWSRRLIKKFGLPVLVFPDIVPSATILGPLRQSLAVETGLTGIQVVASCSHDTGAAVAAVPADGADWAYLSSGTWSLLGIERSKPIISKKSRRLNFTNEVGYGGSIRFLKNITGLWMLQECRRAWGKADYTELMKLAESAAPLKSLIDPDDGRFGKPDNMPDKIAAFCRETNQPAPATPGEYTRCILESLALLYRRTLEQMEEVTGERIKTLHIVGGGSQSTLLNQLAADATGRTVIAGPVEATATGNMLIQAMALGHLKSLEELRAVVRKSFALETCKPQGAASWDKALQRFEKLQHIT